MLLSKALPDPSSETTSESSPGLNLEQLRQFSVFELHRPTRIITALIPNVTGVACNFEKANGPLYDPIIFILHFYL